MRVLFSFARSLIFRFLLIIGVIFYRLLIIIDVWIRHFLNTPVKEAPSKTCTAAGILLLQDQTPACGPAAFFCSSSFFASLLIISVILSNVNFSPLFAAAALSLSIACFLAGVV